MSSMRTDCTRFHCWKIVRRGSFKVCCRSGLLLFGTFGAVRRYFDTVGVRLKWRLELILIKNKSKAGTSRDDANTSLALLYVHTSPNVSIKCSKIECEVYGWIRQRFVIVSAALCVRWLRQFSRVTCVSSGKAANASNAEVQLAELWTRLMQCGNQLDRLTVIMSPDVDVVYPITIY